MTMKRPCRVIEGIVPEIQGRVLQIAGSQLQYLRSLPFSYAFGRTWAVGLPTKLGFDAKPRNRANRCCRQRAYQVCLARSRVRRDRVASITSFPLSPVPINNLMREYRQLVAMGRRGWV